MSGEHVLFDNFARTPSWETFYKQEEMTIICEILSFLQFVADNNRHKKMLI